MDDPDDIEVLEASGEANVAEACSTENPQLNKKSSDIWEYFEKKKDDSGKNIALCKKCPNKSFSFSGGTSTLWRHLQNVHFITKPKPKENETTSSIKNLFAKQEEKQQSIKDAFTRYDIS